MGFLTFPKFPHSKVAIGSTGPGQAMPAAAMTSDVSMAARRQRWSNGGCNVNCGGRRLGDFGVEIVEFFKWIIFDRFLEYSSEFIVRFDKS